MSNVHYLEKCLSKSDLCVIQEHWLYPKSLGFLSSISSDFTGWGRSSGELNMNSIWRRGKRKGWHCHALEKRTRSTYKYIG